MAAGRFGTGAIGMRSKPHIVVHCFGELGLGGPMGSMHRLLGSDLRNKYDFTTCFQVRPAGGINVPMIFRMARQIRAVHPDLLIVSGLQNEGFHGLIAGRLAGCPRVVVSVRGFAGDLKYPHSRLRQSIVSKLLEPYTIRNADGVYCVCEYASKRDVIVRNARRHFGYIHNAVPVPAAISRNEDLRSSLGFTARDVVAICVARITREKGILDLCEALRILEQNHGGSLKFVLVGDGPDFQVVRETAESLKKVQVLLTGKRNDVPALLSMSDLFIFPSLHENLSNALLEAMSFALPVVATNVGGNPEVVLHGETGILLPPHNPTAIADAISLLAGDPDLRKKMGIAGRRRIEDHFSIPQWVDRLDQLYRTILAL
jgi:glycosyltransferase involved in cell wall biosynthesis